MCANLYCGISSLKQMKNRNSEWGLDNNTEEEMALNLQV